MRAAATVSAIATICVAAAANQFDARGALLLALATALPVVRHQRSGESVFPPVAVGEIDARLNCFP
jgi:hypothetical protein